MGVVYHNIHSKRYVHGKGLYPVNTKRYVYGKGIVDTVLSMITPPVLKILAPNLVTTGAGVGLSSNVKNKILNLKNSIKKTEEEMRKLKIKNDIKSGNGFKYV